MGKDLTPAEVSSLWNSYLSNSMAICVTRYFLKTNQDKEIQKALKHAEEMAIQEVEKSRQFFIEAHHPLPECFDEQDVDVNAPRLYSDNFILLNKYVLAGAAASVYSLSLSTSTRSDIRQFYENCITTTAKFINLCADIIVEKGLHNPVLRIPTPEKIEKVDSQSFLAGWLTDRRPINALEINQIELIFETIEVQKEFLRSFVQTAPSKEFRDHFQRGVEIANKHLDILQGILSENDLPKLPTWESEITDLTVAPFSEKLMIFKMSLLTSAAISRYGTALSSVMRRDLGSHFMRMMTELLKYGEDTVNLIIKRGYLEQMPLAAGKHTEPAPI